MSGMNGCERKRNAVRWLYSSRTLTTRTLNDMKKTKGEQTAKNHGMPNGNHYYTSIGLFAVFTVPIFSLLHVRRVGQSRQNILCGLRATKHSAISSKEQKNGNGTNASSSRTNSHHGLGWSRTTAFLTRTHIKYHRIAQKPETNCLYFMQIAQRCKHPPAATPPPPQRNKFQRTLPKYGGHSPIRYKKKKYFHNSFFGNWVNRWTVE